MSLAPSQSDTSTLLLAPAEQSARSSVPLPGRAFGEAEEAKLSRSSCEAGLCAAAHASSQEPVLPAAQRRWAASPVADRLAVVRKARHWMAAHPEAFARAISPRLARCEADTLATEVLPLLDAMRFLERNARKLLAPRKLRGKQRPLWLTGVAAEIHREPFGHVLVIGPANFPLLLAGAQTLQALAAGNAVTWKPGAGGADVAVLLAHVLRQAGLPRGVLHVTGESVQDAQEALAQRPDKVVFTGSFDAGQKVLRTLAETATPAVMELSGADAVVVLPSADLPLTAKAISFGLRLNGAEVCMSPRRVVATRETLDALRPHLQRELEAVPRVVPAARTRAQLTQMILDAEREGARVLLSGLEGTGEERYENSATGMGPVLLDGATPAMEVTRTDVFAPVLSLVEARSVLHIAETVNDNPYGLTAAIFGDAREAQTLAAQLRVGTVIINDLIAPTADARVPFGGRSQSGFGTTRGAEGLLEMTSIKTVLVRRKGSPYHYEPLRQNDVSLMSGLIGALHGGSPGERWRSVKRLITAARTRSR